MKILSKKQFFIKNFILLVLLGLVFFSINGNNASTTPAFIGPTYTNANINHNFLVNFTTSFGPNSRYYPREIQIGYIHPDGLPRIIVGSSQFTDFSMMILKQESNNIFNFTHERTYTYSMDNYSYFEPILVYDFDTDGVEEILAFSSSVPSMMLFLGWNGTEYTSKWSAKAGLLDITSSGAQIYDIDNDGKDELIHHSNSQTKIYSWDPGFINFKLDAILEGGGYRSVGVGDIDNDDVIELITGKTGSDSSLRIYSYDKVSSSYLKEFETSFSGSVHSAGFNSFCVTDIDNDGNKEIYAGTPNYALSTYPIVRFTWNGASFSATNLSFDTAAHFDIVSGDIDGDGLSEVVVDRNSGASTILEIAPNGSTILQSYNNLNAYHQFVLWDFNRDGILELLAGPNNYLSNDLIYSDHVNNLPPVIYSTGDQTIPLGIVDKELQFKIVTRDEGVYSVFINDVLTINSASIISGTSIIFPLDTLSLGVHNYTLIANTAYGEAKNTVLISVIQSDLEPPVILPENIYIAPFEPKEEDIIEISADVTDPSGIYEVKLFYSVNGGAWVKLNMVFLSGDRYYTDIGPFSGGDVVEFYVEAFDESPNRNKATSGIHIINIKDKISTTKPTTQPTTTSEESSTITSQEPPSTSDGQGPTLTTPFGFSLIHIIVLGTFLFFLRRKRS